MNAGPFAVDREVAERIGRLVPTIGAEFVDEVEASLEEGRILPKSAVDRLIASHDLTGPRDAMLLALPAAKAMATPPISGFFVGAVGLESETGDFILGGNLEFPGHDMASTIHGEGFVFARSFARDTSIGALATGQARPCAHCRQTISEFASSRDLRLIDPVGHALTMADLYPWPFTPADLGEPGIVVGALPWPDLAITDPRVPADVARLLVRMGRRAHAPYSRCPSAIALRLSDGSLVGGATIESVAFNPTIGPLQAAIVELIAFGHAYADIASATLATRAGAAVDPTTDTRGLLAAVAPHATLAVTTWA